MCRGFLGHSLFWNSFFAAEEYRSVQFYFILDDTEAILCTPTVTPRQSLILSAISYYVLIASPEEITRYYIASTRRKATVLHFHMEAARLVGKKIIATCILATIFWEFSINADFDTKRNRWYAILI